MKEKQLRLYKSEGTFFFKITKSITKILIPTKVGINGLIISMKRNNLMKAYTNYKKVVELGEENEKEELKKTFNDAYATYLEAIDKHIIEGVYKKVRNGRADEFERKALADYYVVEKIKDFDYTEYKYRKQKYLIELDYQTIKILDKTKIMDTYKKFYSEKVEKLYKKILKNYSVKLADNLLLEKKETIYENIFKVLEDYIVTILPIKFEIDENDEYKQIMDEYEQFENYEIGKLDDLDKIKKKIILMGISRKLFVHSLPLAVTERCYIHIIKQIRELIVKTMNARKREKVYRTLLEVIEQFNIKILSTKIYWDKVEEREEYKKFWREYKNIQKIKNEKEQDKKKQILFVRADLRKVYQNEKKYKTIIQFYKCKLKALGGMRDLKNSCVSEGNYTSVKKNKIKAS